MSTRRKGWRKPMPPREGIKVAPGPAHYRCPFCGCSVPRQKDGVYYCPCGWSGAMVWP